jgi:glycosyltransferase involved in cell wall biosynthesis
LTLPSPRPSLSRLSEVRVAYLFPSLKTGNYWHPILSRFTQTIPQTQVYTGFWGGFSAGYENQFNLTVVGKARFIPLQGSSNGNYVRNISYLSPKILQYLFHLKPQVIFVSAFSMWTLLVVLLKPIARWQLVMLYEGWTPTYDYQDSPLRLMLRKWVTRACDRLISNSEVGATYLKDALGAPADRVHCIPHEVPDLKALTAKGQGIQAPQQAPNETLRLITVGQMIPRKGIDRLLQALHRLRARGYRNLSLVCIGSGYDLDTLQEMSRSLQLEDCVEWVGQIEYDRMGEYLSAADVFVFPTLEDVWGMAPLEAMVWGKPIICSKYSGCAESMILEGKTGFQIDPNDPKTIADAIEKFIQHPHWITLMGAQAKHHITQFSPDTAAQALLTMTEELVQHS